VGEAESDSGSSSSQYFNDGDWEGVVECDLMDVGERSVLPTGNIRTDSLAGPVEDAETPAQPRTD